MVLALATHACLAQQVALALEHPAAAPASQPSSASSAEEATTAVRSPDKKALTDRWLDLKTLTYSARYRNTVNNHGRHLFDFGQQRYVAAGRLKFDPKGNYTVDFHASSGRYFNWAYSDLVGGQYKDSVVAARGFKTAQENSDLAYAVAHDPDGATYKAGLPSRGGYFYPRQLFFSATPIPQVTLEVGSLFIEHGQNSEITSFDEDGYISGERLRLQDPKHLFFDRIAITSAKLGSGLTPNFFERGGDLKKSNYSQYMVEKKFAQRLTASVDYTMLNHTHTMREGISYKQVGGRFIDGARFEAYQRPDTVVLAGRSFASGNGFAVSAHQTFRKKVGFEAGFANVDERYAIYGGSLYLATVGFAWNGDAYETGKRVFTKADIKLANGVSLNGFFTHAVVPITIGHNQQGFTGGVTFDLKAIANSKTKVF